MKTGTLSIACLSVSMLLASCERQVGSSAAATDSQKAGEQDLPANRGAVSGMSRKQREVFRIRETADHLDQVLDLLKNASKTAKITATPGLVSDLVEATIALATLEKEIQREEADQSVNYPSAGRNGLDTVFTQILGLEKQMVWPEGSSDGKTVAAHLVAASDAFESTAKPTP